MYSRRNLLKKTGAVGALGITGVSGCIGSFGEQSYGNGEINFMMSPSEPQDYMRSQYKPYADHLQEQTGTTVSLKYAADYSAVLQGLGSGTADIAETGPFAAALGVKADKANIALQRHAYGSWDYTSVIVTKKDSGIDSLSDLEGEKVGFADMTSASGSLYPLYMLQKAGLSIGEAPVSDSGADFTGTWSGHAEAFAALENDQVAAAGVGKFITQADDGELADGYKYVKTYEGIPRAPMVVSPNLSEEGKNDVINALQAAPEKVYYGADGESDTDDDLWFDDVRTADLKTYEPVIKVANELELSTDLLNQG
ncbi:phosphate/phosphite/phosphonate ABC transporter substrate-binding protein [Haloferax mediterranei ATCC 33500]|uniref:ABC-type phosphate/phosphonate/phosphite transport system, substrate-binding protein n=1 Tax=Haloferax mediterranei (strain ATCC 33500 / DSM 1411 / JCM 8866 / NBRC 14739 / NCIMB 2177 / R-4) TaxID=523841 RepID=I3R1N8_HALMT|nr:phosphate/phosphite/phosphonate ABC transporter substrate-binding protein [Haloferax mediterranei]AFK18148.1 ABC-type phosphate/phosphonate/phosphite transport system, substrate-binding protein [Haloferax mediterranei ATCC 33500]AHZ22444.1 phosphate ABC transporter substrate-binding protein [Haloferax mediterranei ATCC 33500]EMA02579.1 ABC-type phosphate/phosphonate/phosphite transport system, substrate-binding protein [Haloferax mediterranei ATCC 33500]MDX5988238.1 phosphate/phosphite/phosp